jgi:Arc/MetJ-type ribon-helix-helix transcriptional regulator
MHTAAKKQYQNTTVRVPRHIYEQARSAIERGQASSFNEFIVQAIEEKVRRLTEAEIDAAFSQMASDTDYQRDAVAMATEFEKSDWEALQARYEAGAQELTKKPTKPHAHARAAKTRSR